MRGPYIALASLALVGGCAMQPDYQRPSTAVPAEWANGSSRVARAVTGRGAWWTDLGDPAIDRLVSAAFADNPTLGEAAARVDQARAIVGVERARRLPRVDLNAGIGIARGAAGASGGSVTTTSASIGPSLSWEIDLWGRVRETTLAARSRLGGRDADAEDARLSIAAQIADNVLELRGCDYSLSVRDSDIASRQTELATTRIRLRFGNIAPYEVASAESNLAAARTDRISQNELCLRTANALVAATLTRFGRLDILVNNAGGGIIRPFLDHTPETLRATIDRNLWTAIWCSYHALPVMKSAGRGRLVNIGADSVRNGLFDHAGYNAAKGGMHGMTTALAREFARDGITVNTVAPCAVRGAQYDEVEARNPELIVQCLSVIPMSRAAGETEVASMVAYLCTDGAAFVTGQVISVNGGSTML